MDPSLIPSPPSEEAKAWAHAFAGITITLNVIAFLVFTCRIYTRSFPTFRLSADDYVISIAWLLIILESTFLLLTVPFVFGRDPASITLADLINSDRHAVIAQPLWAWGMAAIKNSIALMLLRLESNLALRKFLWGNIILQVVVAFYNMLSQLLQCFPLRKVWDLLGVVPGKCWSAKAIRINLICQSSVIVVTDLIFALMPISFLRKVQRPLRERVIIGCLMGLGVLASAASIAKMQASLKLSSAGDATTAGIQVGMWSAIEELIAFICACLPCLRSPFRRMMKSIGLIATTRQSSSGRGYYNFGDSGPVKRSEPRSGNEASGSGIGIKLKSMRSADTQSEEVILTNDEVRNGEIWCTTEVEVQDQARTKIGDQEEQRAQTSWSNHGAISPIRNIRQVT